MNRTSVEVWRFIDMKNFNSRWKFRHCRMFKFYFLSKEKTHPRGTFESMLFEHRLNKENLINSRRSFARKVSVGFDVSMSGAGGRFVFLFLSEGEVKSKLDSKFWISSKSHGLVPKCVLSTFSMNTWLLKLVELVIRAADWWGDVVEVWRR